MFIHRNQINFAFLQAISIDASWKKKTKALEFSTSRTLDKYLTKAGSSVSEPAIRETQ